MALLLERLIGVGQQAMTITLACIVRVPTLFEQ